MIKFARMAALAAAATLVAAPAVAAPTTVSNGPVTATARIVKPLRLDRVADMNFGDIVVQDAGTATLATDGTIGCTANLTCSGATSAAQYMVYGTNNQWVTVTKPDVILDNTDGSGAQLTLVLSGPATLQLQSSGQNGTALDLGGSIAIAANTREGVYEGDLAVVVDYQ